MNALEGLFGLSATSVALSPRPAQPLGRARCDCISALRAVPGNEVHWGGDAPSLFTIDFLLRATAMFAPPWLRTLLRRWSLPRPIRLPPLRRRVRLHLEGLEERSVPAVFNVGAGDVATLIADINTA